MAQRVVAKSSYDYLYVEVLQLYKGKKDTLDTLGFQVGFRYIERFAMQKHLLKTTVDALRFLCQDVWKSMFGKWVDKLQTNHKGIFVLHDNNFQWLSRLSATPEELLKEAEEYLIFPCGVVRGILYNLGIPCTVKAEVTKVPSCQFNIRVVESDAR